MHIFLVNQSFEISTMACRIGVCTHSYDIYLFVVLLVMMSLSVSVSYAYIFTSMVCLFLFLQEDGFELDPFGDLDTQSERRLGFLVKQK